jgi:NADH-ubiquinone oxidoreductase chain 5
MEGPTPVSALIHAATMVTAGVYLLIKCSFLFEYTPTVLNIVVCVGSFTSLFAASVGMLQQDIKKVIAYSTCSQLGYMFTACGLSQYSIALFHLSNHAVFKALLFLSAGALIHNLSNEQDLRKYGGLNTIMPLTIQTIFIGSCALMGLPFLTGFYSKDLIIELTSVTFVIPSKMSFLFLNFAAAATAFYSIRVLY